MSWITGLFTLLKAIPKILDIIDRIIEMNKQREIAKRKGQISDAKKKLASKKFKDRVDGLKDLQNNYNDRVAK